MAAGFLEDKTADEFWERTADAVADWVDSADVCQIMVDAKGGTSDRRAVSRNRPGNILEEYAAHYPTEDQRVPAVLASQGRSLGDVDAFGERELEHSAPVSGFLDRPEVDLRCCIARAEVLDDRATVLVALIRPRSRGAFETDDAKRPNALPTHVLDAPRVRTEVDTAPVSASRLSAVMNALGQPIIVVDRSLAVKFVNTSGLNTLDSHALVGCSRGKLAARRPADQRALEAAVHRSCEMHEGTPASGAPPLVFRNEEAPRELLVLSFTPLPRTDKLVPQAEVMISISPQMAPDKLVRAVLRAHGCSRAEEETAVAVLNGQDLVEIGRDRFVSIETVRSQLKAAMRKVDCTRQKDLVRLLKSFC